jgi:glucosamine--fructose-6-phosphate aminotransferase (isomerizing)
MCGIFGAVGSRAVDVSRVKILASHSKQRGSDSSGILWSSHLGDYRQIKADRSIATIVGKVPNSNISMIVGHSRLITNGMEDNQPIEKDGVSVFHNGIVLNHQDLWSELDSEPALEVDTEIIAEIASRHIAQNGTVAGVGDSVLGVCLGSISCAIVSPNTGEISLFSNTGSMYVGELDGVSYFASERFALQKIGVKAINQVRQEVLLGIVKQTSRESTEIKIERPDLVQSPTLIARESDLLEYRFPELQRCMRCILPITMPFIKFDLDGICNYCNAYKPKNSPKPSSDLNDLLAKYRRTTGPEAIMPFSGGRDSSYALHLVTREFNIRSIAYTYDWGMVTDLGRRNISRMCGALGVENIVVAADIAKKRRNISKNLSAWINQPHLGMLSLLTAGDKHFFKYVETVKRQTGLSLNLWGVNPLETTHFKAGYLGVPPDFEMQGVYSSGLSKQLSYQKLRFAEMARNPAYINGSIWDTLSGEYHRSVAKRSDYFHIFDYWRWDENEINQTLVSEYDWEVAEDTSTTWRIGDGTAGFYNYVYFTVGGFSEHDTFRSNQIREGDITRDEALELSKVENAPRYENIKWYLDAAGIDFKEAISAVNAIPKLYR